MFLINVTRAGLAWLSRVETITAMGIGASAVVLGMHLATADAAQAAVPAPVSVPVVSYSDRTNSPTESPVYAVTVNTDTAEVAEDRREVAAFQALVESGNRGAVNDGRDDTVYPHIGTVVEIAWRNDAGVAVTGLATVTYYGLAFCEDAGTSDASRCTGAEYMTDAWLQGA